MTPRRWAEYVIDRWALAGYSPDCTETITDMIESAITAALAEQAEAHAKALAEMRSVLERTAIKFREYERLHAAKPDLEKARRNAEMAEMCEAALRARSP